MGTEARVRLGLRSPGRPGFPSLDHGSEAWFVSEERRASPALGLWGAEHGSGSLLPVFQPNRPEASRRVFLGTGLRLFRVPATLWAGDSSFRSAVTVSKVLSCRA